MGFKASEHMSLLDYQFGPTHSRTGEEIKGTTPEPPSEAVNRFTNRMAKLAENKGYTVTDPSDLREVAEVFGKMTEEHMDEIDADSRELTAELCQGSPSRDQIFSLHHRPYQAWLGWLQGELQNPEGSTDATRNSHRLRSVG